MQDERDDRNEEEQVQPLQAHPEPVEAPSEEAPASIKVEEKLQTDPEQSDVARTQEEPHAQQSHIESPAELPHEGADPAAEQADQ